ncbi:MAG TPA: hypothetical protein VMS96_06550 [Terriglobales bacterium]|nr:hypothetical protein [Terriglobales bacterium]
MLGLRRWHVNLLVSEAIATAIVLWAYNDVIKGREGPHVWANLLAGFGGSIVLSPGSGLMSWMKDPPLWAVCLAAAVVYSLFFFLVATTITHLIDVGRFSALKSMRIRGGEQQDLHRYLR